MSYLAKWVSEVKEGETITAADVEVLARVHQALLASDKHHQQARDAQANVAEKLVVSRAVEFVDAVDVYSGNGFLVSSLVAAHFDLRAAVANLLAVEAAS